MTQEHAAIAEQIVEVGRLMYQKGWVAANDGNISVRLSDGRFLCTPTGVSKGLMRAEHMVICDDHGNKVEGTRDRTSEFLMHLTVYEMRPDVHAVVHAHPPVSTGFAAAGRALDRAVMPEVVVSLGCVPLANYGLPGTPELSETLKPWIPRYDALMMANHGVVAYGEDLMQAFFRLETVEHVARILLVAEMLGGARTLPRNEVDRLIEARGRYGVRSSAEPQPGFPIVAEDLEELNTTNRHLSREELLQALEELLRSRNIN
jgi:L-fuculose-phosphate aldolase